MSYELKTLKAVFKEYIKCTKCTNHDITYRDIYDDYLHNTHFTGVYDRTTGILDKWLWKYRDYTPAQIISLTNL